MAIADGLSRQPPRKRCQNEECVDCGLNSDHARSGGDSDRERVNLVVGSPETDTKFRCHCEDCIDCGPRNGSLPDDCKEKEEVNMLDEQPGTSQEAEIEVSNWVKQWSKSQISTWQQADNDLSKIMEMIGQGVPKPPYKEIKAQSEHFKALWSLWEELEISEGVLRRLQINPKRSVLQCVAPKEIRKFILDQLHNKKLELCPHPWIRELRSPTKLVLLTLHLCAFTQATLC